MTSPPRKRRVLRARHAEHSMLVPGARTRRAQDLSNEDERDECGPTRSGESIQTAALFLRRLVVVLVVVIIVVVVVIVVIIIIDDPDGVLEQRAVERADGDVPDHALFG